ncbi:MAG TPA: hypothetical protein VKZ60_05325 [Chloroflexota bacterium]|nr:hypothetical protein [Chloroflexota bacterium]
MRTLLLLLTGLGLLLRGPAPAAAQAEADERVAAATAAVLQAHAEHIYRQAYLTLDPTSLAEAWGGEALLDMQEDLARLRAAGQYLDLQLEDLTVLRAMPLGAQRVRVITREQWLVRVYQRDGQLLGHQRQLVDNRYVVQRDDATWRIVEVDQEVVGGDRTLQPGEP